MTTLTYERRMKTGKIVKFTYDEIDKELIESIVWSVCPRGYIVGHKLNEDGIWKGKRLHRMMLGEPEGMVVDHINGIKNDNTRKNLRVCTQRQNGMNQCTPTNNKSGVKGVFWYKRIGKWCAQIKVNKKTKYLGVFEDLDEATEVRRIAEEKYFGEFRRK